MVEGLRTPDHDSHGALPPLSQLEFPPVELEASAALSSDLLLGAGALQRSSEIPLLFFSTTAINRFWLFAQ